jgi:hypothetical protein
MHPEMEDMVTTMEGELIIFRELSLRNPTANDYQRLQAACLAVTKSLGSMQTKSEFQSEYAKGLIKGIQQDIVDV